MGYETDTAGTLVDKRAEIIRIGVGGDEKMIQRYECGSGRCALHVKSEDGKWVLWADHFAALTKKDEQIAALKIG